MKILTNKETYVELQIDTKWKVKAISDNPYFSHVVDRSLHIIQVEQCKGKQIDRCPHSKCTPYERDIVEGISGDCAQLIIEYKYSDASESHRQCYHTFIDGAEQID